MNNLTEQWKKGKLPSGWYYIKGGDGGIYPAENCPNYDYINDKVDNQFYYTEDEIEEIIDKVPSYEEWQRALHYAGKYEHEYTSCVMDYENLKEENTKLKKLLKECKLAIFDYPPYDLASDKIRLQIKINQVLGEE